MFPFRSPLWLLLVAVTAWAHPQRPHLSDGDVELIERTYALPESQRRGASAERAYQSRVQAQTLRDAAEIYDPRNQSLLKITYAAFTSDGSSQSGPDSGYGFHVVKRLERTLSDGSTKIIEVNEAWPDDRRTGALLPLDEIRIKTTYGSQETGAKRFLFDLVRLAWGPEGQVEVVRQNRFDGNQRLQRRHPVGAPGSCLNCHGRSAPSFQSEFLEGGGTVETGTIVSPDYYGVPLKETLGLRAYVNSLRSRGASAEFVTAVERDLVRPEITFAVEGLADVLRGAADSRSYYWLEEDHPVVGGGETWWLERQGFYRDLRTGRLFREAIEEVFEGKYRWWEPRQMVPSGGGYGN